MVRSQSFGFGGQNAVVVFPMGPAKPKPRCRPSDSPE
jgi:hypothetical protein